MPEQDRRILLWPQGTAPDSDICASQEQPSLIPYPAAGSANAVIVCPGGGYGILVMREGLPIAEMLNRAGIAAYVLCYRVNPFTSADTPIGDAQRAIRLLRSMGYEKVGIMGFSAGGHLVAMTAVHYDAGNAEDADPVERFSSRPDAFASCYGATGEAQYADPWWRKQLWGIAGETGVSHRRYCAENNVTPETPPAFIWQTADDPTVPVENAFALARALGENAVPYALHVFTHGPHGMGLAETYPELSVWPKLFTDWLHERGF